LIVRELPGELVVYDRERHQAHCLNAPAALVFRRADGTRSVSELSRELREALGAAYDEAWVRLALDRLDRAQLLEAPPPPPSPRRRQILKRGAVAAALLPVVSTLLVPTPAEAANTCLSSCPPGSDGQPCHNGIPALGCSPNCFCNGGVCLTGAGTSCPS
jgi:hypothetical protein